VVLVDPSLSLKLEIDLELWLWAVTFKKVCHSLAGYSGCLADGKRQGSVLAFLVLGLIHTSSG